MFIELKKNTWRLLQASCQWGFNHSRWSRHLVASNCLWSLLNRAPFFLTKNNGGWQIKYTVLFRRFGLTWIFSDSGAKKCRGFFLVKFWQGVPPWPLDLVVNLTGLASSSSIVPVRVKTNIGKPFCSFCPQDKLVENNPARENHPSLLYSHASELCKTMNFLGFTKPFLEPLKAISGNTSLQVIASLSWKGGNLLSSEARGGEVGWKSRANEQKMRRVIS